MNKIIIAVSFCLSMFLFSSFSQANHCSGGHKEIKETKETKETTSEESKNTKSN